MIGAFLIQRNFDKLKEMTRAINEHIVNKDKLEDSNASRTFGSKQESGTKNKNDNDKNKNKNDQKWFRRECGSKNY